MSIASSTPFSFRSGIAPGNCLLQENGRFVEDSQHDTLRQRLLPNADIFAADCSLQ
ncbi:hypothetical protein MAXJ12_32609 [Mesorhizobium alhagi CCNWXJ12-2]|jgi:hypothetical protein|uniref:Uncharacterized protein n=1 Tax=Mesorhizobium alhagi CCNWXJ12-2 TaxID=1107882 RepID=H0I224_9HYPH|nr:hypothetical protein MAXJ12_32609 [Mesorhizobium alhagi CCNWXJ12-2]